MKAMNVTTLEAGDITLYRLPETRALHVVLSPRGERQYRLLTFDTDAQTRRRTLAVVGTARHLNILRTGLADAQPVAEGVYRIVRHGDHTHFAYAMASQSESVIEPEADYLISIENPRRTAQSGDPGFPERLQETFKGRQSAPLDPVAFLDYRDATLHMAVATLDPKQEPDLIAQVIGDLPLQANLHPVAAA